MFSYAGYTNHLNIGSLMQRGIRSGSSNSLPAVDIG